MRTEQLTQLEFQIMWLRSMGLPIKKTAYRLGISVSAVHWQYQGIKKKLQLHGGVMAWRKLLEEEGAL